MEINLTACLFALYFVIFKFGSVITYMVTPVAKFKNASSRTKILRLIVLRSNLKSNLAKFANFTHRDPHPKNIKFDLNPRRFALAKLCRHL
nr:hypothetical protein [uncultured Campylobacter sp.]